MPEVSPGVEKKLNKILDKHITEEGNMISILQNIQDELGYISEDAVSWFSRKLDIPESRFFGIATFYAQFHLTPRGKNIITACCGTACYVKGSDRLITIAIKELNLSEEQETTEDKKITFEKVACLGTCSMAPVVIINKKMYGKMTPERLKKEIKTFRKKQ